MFDVLVEEIDQRSHAQCHDDSADAHETAEQEADDDGCAVEQDARIAEGQASVRHIVDDAAEGVVWSHAEVQAHVERDTETGDGHAAQKQDDAGSEITGRDCEDRGKDAVAEVGYGPQ